MTALDPHLSEREAFRFENTYARLPERFYARVAPAKVRAPAIVKVNRPLADALGVDAAALDSPAGAEVLAGNVIPVGAEPIALAYAGHQFGGFVLFDAPVERAPEAKRCGSAF